LPNRSGPCAVLGNARGNTGMRPGSKSETARKVW